MAKGYKAVSEEAIAERLDFAKKLTVEAGHKAQVYFKEIAHLVVEQKGAQDFVSNADLAIEVFIREQLNKTYPDDGIVGEEHADQPSRSGYIWVIDPIDGTANFVNGIPMWCVVLACVYEDETRIGVIYEPCHDELFWGAQGQGAFLNDQPIKASSSQSVAVGSVGVGMNRKVGMQVTIRFVEHLVAAGGVFYRNASGALSLCYVAAGRLIGYSEAHMNAWDCLAGQLLVAEAGGAIETQSANAMLASGGRVVVGGAGVFGALQGFADAAYDEP